MDGDCGRFLTLLSADSDGDQLVATCLPGAWEQKHRRAGALAEELSAGALRLQTRGAGPGHSH